MVKEFLIVLRSRRRRNPSRTSPRESRRACLCRNGLYSRKCCNGNMINQGLGRIHSDGIIDTIIKRPPRAFSEGFSNGFE